mgnify:CR=1 FL=1
MQGADKGQAGRLDGHDLRVGIVQARFNDELTSRMAALCIEELTALGVQAKHIQHVTVPGALEVPVALQAMADSERFDALVALESGAGVTRVSLDHHVPVANAILTVENQAQAEARVEEKSRDAARVAVEMANLLDELL